MIEDEVILFGSFLELIYPIDEGIIRNPDDLFKLWENALNNKLKIEKPSESRIFVIEIPLNLITNKKTSFEILFEQIGVKAMNIKAQNVLYFVRGLLSHFIQNSDQKEDIFLII
jgi:actin-related protein 2